MSMTMETNVELDDVITAEDIAFARRLKERLQNPLTPYRQTLIKRLEEPDEKLRPAIQYQRYRLMAGTHVRYDLEEIAKAAVRNQERFKRLGPNAQPENPREHTFVPGDIITPETDAEALLMDQDPGKFQPLGAGFQQAEDKIAELLAENARLKLQLSAKDETPDDGKGQGKPKK